MAKKKVPNIAGRFGPRYGVTLRKRWNLVMLKRTAKYRCPKCLSRRFMRESVGVWACRKCGFKMAGGAYQPSYLQEVLRKR